MEDNILQMFLEDTREHLADIETDLLDIEEAGPDFDPELVNKVFRTAHSIKGSASFLGLKKIRDISHKIENVLDMIRSREIEPSSSVVNIILAAFDKLEEMVDNVQHSEETDISAHVDNLTAVVTSHLPEEHQDKVSKTRSLTLPDGRPVFEVCEHDILQAQKGGNYIYLVEYDLIHDVHKKGKTPLELMRFLEKSGLIMDCKMDIAQVGDLDQVISNRIPFNVLYATILEPELVNAIFQVEQRYVHLVTEDAGVWSSTASAESTPEKDQSRDLDSESLDDLERQLSEAMASNTSEPSTVAPPKPHPSLTAGLKSNKRGNPEPASEPEPESGHNSSVGEFDEEFGGYQFKGTSEQATLFFSGATTIERGADMKEALLSALDKAQKLTVDLSEVEEADLALLQLLIAAKRTARARDVILEIAPNLSQAVEDAAIRAGFDGKLEPAMEEAL